MRPSQIDTLISELREIVGPEYLLTDSGDRDFFSQDLSFEDYAVASAIAQPSSIEDLAAVVRIAYALGVPIIPRGGGMSYTEGFTPKHPNSLVIDMQRMNRVLDVSVQNMYVTVECGCTWELLYDTLRKLGVRTPYYGPNSGRYATVGGALSQNSVWWGAGRHGMVADSILSLEVVVSNGRIIKSGSAANPKSSPFFRYWGPDLCGLFLSDAGALGIKAIATLRLVPMQSVTYYESVAVDGPEAAIECMEQTSRLGLASEIYSLDPFYADSLARTGLEYFKQCPWTVHFIVDGLNPALATDAMGAIREVAHRHGKSIPADAPQKQRAVPFGNVESVLLGPDGQIWLPLHAIVPYSRARSAITDYQAFAHSNRELFREHNIQMSLLTLASQNDLLIEPSFYWFDALGSFRLERISPESAEKWKRIPEDRETRGIVLKLRRELATRFGDLGAVHIQLGKYYDFQSQMDSATWDTIVSLKRLFDPRGLINPGALGLPQPSP